VNNKLENNNEILEERKSNSAMIKLMLAIFLALGSVVYIMYRGASNRAYKEKWQDYDECGLG